MSSLLTNQAKKVMAERMFVEDGMTAKAIAEQLDVSEQTLSKWRKGKEGEKSWDDKRAEMLASPHKIKEILLKELILVAGGEKSKVDADALAKINKVIESLSDKISVQVVFSVFKEFDNWMADQDPKTAILFTEWHKQFLLYKINLEG
ncbi:transposase [Flavobacterium sp. F-65]|uniref:Transposase n=1 Tax=Flavobacterium pisciphilum TaxID=2893755 RepID=A0ABS8MWB8_9FLAO|nr:helix-turn-helix domain-containing protein [Flavobacterium sp. F-65]MCC9072461.1 transposase [Flavobacterium sp. F-65]